MRRLLERMTRIERMERGRLCKMTGREHYNHQTWVNGRNVVRYVPAQRIASLQEAIEGYRLFVELAEQYAGEIIRRTRTQNASPGTPRTAHSHGGQRKRP